MSGPRRTRVGPAGGGRRRVDRIDAAEGAYANLALPAVLGRSGLDARDRRFVTELVYGTTRMRRACDYLVDRYLAQPPTGRARNVLRVGAYQVAFAGVPAHAAVSETVAIAPKSVRGLTNAVLRKVAADPVAWPSDAVRLSVPDWVLAALTADLGPDLALAALEAMNAPAEVTERPDGYVQDLASQQVAAAVGAGPGDLVLDLCAAPGGKATALAAAGATVIAGDAPVAPRRAGGAATPSAPASPIASPRWSPTPPARRCAPAAPTTCWWTPRARAWARCGAAPTCAGGPRPTRSSAWPPCSARWWGPPRTSCGPAARSPTPCAR